MYKNILESLIGSYDDFVIVTNDWMEKDENIKNAILSQLKSKPDSNTDDITSILWDYLGIGEPLDIVDNDII